jgi:hypothetical protein
MPSQYVFKIYINITSIICIKCVVLKLIINAHIYISQVDTGIIVGAGVSVGILGAIGSAILIFMGFSSFDCGLAVIDGW